MAEGVDDDLSCDALTGSYRILQRRRGHRFSLDDLATAWVAADALPGARSALDLGCGIGSVMLMVGWRLPEARLFGIEAQPASLALARRNVALNDQGARATVIEGDLREVTRGFAHGPCDLVTGTPPYLPEGTAIPSPDPQRAAARIELRGGVEDYLAAAARVLADGGRVVVCADGRFPERVIRGAEAAGLRPIRRIDVMAREGAAAPLFGVWTCAREGVSGGCAREVVAMRDARGDRTEASRAMRRAFGLDAG